MTDKKMRPGFESFKTRAHLFIDCRRRCRRYSQQSRRYCHRWSDSHPSMCRCHPGRCCCLWFRYWYPATGDPSRPEQVCTASTHTVWTVHCASYRYWREPLRSEDKEHPLCSQSRQSRIRRLRRCSDNLRRRAVRNPHRCWPEYGGHSNRSVPCRLQNIRYMPCCRADRSYIRRRWQAFRILCRR